MSAVACALRFDDAPVGIAQCALVKKNVRIAAEICVFSHVVSALEISKQGRPYSRWQESLSLIRTELGIAAWDDIFVPLF